MTTWYRVTRWDSTPFAREVVRQTAKQIVFEGGRRSMIVTNWFQWFPTEAEALADIAARRSEGADREAARRIRDAAPDLLAALEMMRGWGCPACCGDCASANPPVTSCPMTIVGAAIAKARGQ